MRPLSLIVFVISWIAAGPLFAKTITVAQNNQKSADVNIGDINSPLRTLGAALRRLEPGDTLLIGEGVYRETLSLPKKNWHASQKTYIRPIANQKVVIKGSDVITDWRQVKGGYYASPWARKPEPEQVFVNGQAFEQVGGTIFAGYPLDASHPLIRLHSKEGGIWPARSSNTLDQIPVGGFYFDRAKRRLLINLGAKTVANTKLEVSTRPLLLDANSVAGMVIENLEFEHSNTSFDRRGGAVRVKGSDNVLSNIKVKWADAIGVHLVGDRNTLINSSVTFSGQLGASVRGVSNRILGNYIANNNMRGFNKYWEAGGIKLVGEGGAHGTLVDGNVVAFNHGDGIWFDWLNTDNIISNNLVAYNDGFGIHYEASQGAKIVGNNVIGNKQRGIYLFQSWDSTVAYNVIVGNGLEAIVAMGSDRVAEDADITPRNNFVAANVVAWNKNPQLIFPASSAEHISASNTFIGEDETSFSLGWPSVFKMSSKGLPAWQNATGNDRQSISILARMPSSLKDVLEGRKLDFDWSEYLGVWVRGFSIAMPDKKKIDSRLEDNKYTKPGVQISTIKAVLSRQK